MKCVYLINFIGKIFYVNFVLSAIYCLWSKFLFLISFTNVNLFWYKSLLTVITYMLTTEMFVALYPGAQMFNNIQLTTSDIVKNNEYDTINLFSFG